MAKGFGQNSDIRVESAVNSRSGDPAVIMRWGREEGQLTPDEAREHAFGIYLAAISAELDACLVKWATDKLSMPDQQAVGLLQLLRNKRNAGEIPSCTMNMGNGEHMRPETARQRAKVLLEAAFNTEAEAFLVVFLLQDLGQSPDVADQVIQEFRAMRGAVTLWTEDDRP